MNLIQEIHWHEGLFLCPQHLQLFQREITKGFTETIRAIFDFPYGVINCKINNDRLMDENIVEFIELKALMPSGYYINLDCNSYIPPFSIENILIPERKTTVLYLGLPYWGRNKANLSSRNELKNNKIARIYSVTEEEYSDENTGFSPKNLSVRNLNPRIFTEDESHVDCEVIPILRIKKGEDQQEIIDNTFSPPCFKLSGSNDLRNIIKRTVISLSHHTKEYKEKHNKLYVIRNSIPQLQLPVHKLRIISAYSAELNEIILKTNPPPFNIYLIFKKLLTELCSIIPAYALYEVEEYNHNTPYLCFAEIKNILEEVLKVQLFKRNTDRIIFKKDKYDVYQAEITEKDINDKYDYFISIKTKINHDYLIKKVEEGFSFKCLPSALVNMQAVPGVKLTFVPNPPDELFREYDEYYFKIKILECDLWEKAKELKEISITERLKKEEGILDEISLVVLYGGNK
jgi:type VI secretion system protein ImpJ